MADLVRIRLDGFLQLQNGVQRGMAILQRPFAGKRGRDCLDAVRHRAKHSVSAQFRTKQFIGLGGSSYSWKKTGPFGRRSAPKETMVREGKYKRAWLGGAGTYEKITDNEIQFGVSRGAHPQVAMHQKEGPTRITANPNNRTRKGFLAMQIKLLYLAGIWFGEDFLLRKGFIMQPRKIGVNRSMAESVVAVLQREFLAAVRGRGASR